MLDSFKLWLTMPVFIQYILPSSPNFKQSSSKYLMEKKTAQCWILYGPVTFNVIIGITGIRSTISLLFYPLNFNE